MYRDATLEAKTSETLDDLRSLARRLHGGARKEEAALEGLILAGQLEAALADAGDTSLPITQLVTDGFAGALVGETVHPEVILNALADVRMPERVRFRRPEGYAYYGLDPRSYAELASTYDGPASLAAVVGVRSIGTSLSAVVAKTLERRGVPSARISVRPSGTPWSRALVLRAEERRFVTRLRDSGATFFVTDEGPGQSGTTFLAVAEALEQEGVSSSRIVLFGSHVPDWDSLVGLDARERFSRFRFLGAAPLEPPPGWLDFSAGAWRAHSFDHEGGWPSSWVQAERAKYRSPDGNWLAKFEGFPPHGSGPTARAERLSDAGFSPEVASKWSGFTVYSWKDGRPARAGDKSEAVLLRLARYCAFRTEAFPVSNASVTELEAMARVNLVATLGHSAAQRLLPLHVRLPVIPDGRMMPYEWILRPDGTLLKTDAVDHGDDHFLPGPTDIAWDLAGAAIEWRMNTAHREFFVRAFERMTGDPVRHRLPGFLIAYAAFRAGISWMASLAASAAERARTERAARLYRDELELQCGHRVAR